METTVRPQTESTHDCELLYFASSILLAANQIVSGIQMIAAALLRYAQLGIVITESLIRLTTLHHSRKR